MYGACHQFFSRSGFTGDEDGRITRCDFGDARENIFQSGRCSNELFKHRGFVDFFTQSDVFLTKPVFRLLAVFDVGSGHIPTRNLSLFVVQWVVTEKKPAITSVTFAQSHLQLESSATGASTIRIPGDPLPVIAMKELTPIGRYRAIDSLPPLLKSKAEVIERDAVYKETFAVGTEYTNKLWREVDYLTELRFLLADLVFRPLAIFDVGDDAIPFDDVAGFISQRHAPHQVPAIFPICAPETQLVLRRLAAGNAREPIGVVSLKIIGVSCGMPTRSGD